MFEKMVCFKSHLKHMIKIASGYTVGDCISYKLVPFIFSALKITVIRKYRIENEDKRTVIMWSWQCVQRSLPPVASFIRNPVFHERGSTFRLASRVSSAHWANRRRCNLTTNRIPW